MPFAELPEDLWKLVLQHVPLQQRLAACALVCHKLHAAAIAATDSIQTCLRYQHTVSVFVEFLQQHGSHLTSITVKCAEPTDYDWLVMKQVPLCQHLQQLSLTGFNVHLSPSGGRPGALDCVTGLTRLELRDCAVDAGWKGGIAALSVLANLQHLCFTHDPEVACYPAKHLKLASLHHSTYLELGYVDLDGVDLRHVSSLAKLRVLHINSPTCRVEGTAPDAFPFPPSLQHFYFRGSLGPGGLEGAVQLTSLVLMEVEVTSLSQGDEADDDEGGAYLLSVLNNFHHLHTLCLSDLTIEWPPPSPAYRALVASSNLRSLTFGGYLPAGALAHIFSPAYTLQLTKLELHVDGRFLDGAGTVRALVNCCPLLQQLQLRVQAGPHLTCLTELSALTQLKLWVDSHNDADVTESVQCLSGLSRLRQLSLSFGVCRVLGGKALLPLTGLRQLSKLSLRSSFPYALTDFMTKAGPDQAPDVWLQLLEHCAAGGSCYPSVIRSLAQQLAEQQQQNAALQELVANQGAQLQALQAQVQSCLQHLQPL